MSWMPNIPFPKIHDPGFLLSSAVSVWIIRHGDYLAEIERLSGLLSGEETGRRSRYVFPNDRQKYTITRGLLRIILSEFTGVSPATLEFSYNENGKPYLKKGGGIDFSVSHTDEYSSVAVNTKGRVGMDMECVERIGDMQPLVNSFFTKKELFQWNAVEAGMRRKAFFKWWVQKEAYLKYRGTGITGGIGGFDVNIFPEEAAELSTLSEGDAGDPGFPKIEYWEPFEDYCASVCF